jgi:hypothetical protein
MKIYSALLPLALLCISNTFAASPQTEAFMTALTEHLDKRWSAEERAQFEAYLATEGRDNIANSYYQFGQGICSGLSRGESKESLLESGAAFFGPVLGEAIFIGAVTAICPEFRDPK